MNRKFVLSALLSLTVVFVATAIIGGIKVKAEGDVIASGTCGEEATWTLDSDYKLIISGSGVMADYEWYDDTPWADYRTQITGIEIGDDITRIGNYAFSGCTSVTDVTIPSSITYIGEDAFYESIGIEDVYLRVTDPSNFTWNESGRDDFKPNNDTTLHYYRGLNFGDKLSKVRATYVDDLYFEENMYNGIIWKITLSGEMEIEFIGDMEDFTPGGAPWADYADRITSITIYDGPTYLGAYSFEGFSLITEISLPSSLLKIGEGAFKDCSNLEYVYFSTNVKEIGDSAFEGCTALGSGDYANGTVVFPETLQKIGSSAFKGCSNLTSLAFPANLNYIGEDAFYLCTGITTIDCTVKPGNLTWLDSNSNDFMDSKGTICYVGSVCVGNFETKFSDVNVTFEGKSIAGDEIPGTGVSWILDGDGTLYINGNGDMPNYYDPTQVPWYNYKDNIYSIVIENGITSVGWNAFNSHNKVSSVEIPDTITNIGQRSFLGCGHITSIDIPRRVTQIGERAFYSCGGLKSVTMGNDVDNIGIGAFSGCESLQSINLSNNLFAISDSTFYECKSLTSINIPRSVVFIGPNAFERSGLVSVSIPEGVEIIDRYAFQNCSGLASVTISSTVRNIGFDAFYGCDSLTDVYCYAYPDSEEFNWTEGSCDDFINDGSDKTKCHVSSDDVDAFIAMFSTGNEDTDVNVEFVGDLAEDIGEKLKGYSLSLEGDIGVNFFMKLDEDLASSSTAKMVFTISSIDGSESRTQEVYVNPQSNSKLAYAKTEGDNYIFKCRVYAKEMTSLISAQIVDGERQGNVYTYTVQSYAKYILNHSSEFEDEQEIVKAMLHYGTYTQMYFADYNSSNYADSVIDYYEEVPIITDYSMLRAYSGDGSIAAGVSLRLTSANLVLDSETIMNLKFAGASDYSGLIFKLNDQTKLPCKISGDTATVTVRNIPAHKINDDYVIYVYDGKTLLGTVTYSPMFYCYNAIVRPESEDRTPVLKQNVSAYIYFYEAAVNYINK